MKKIKYSGLDEFVYYEKLPNGLEVYMYPNNKSKNFYITYNTKFGSMDTEFKLENEKKFTKVPQGTAHFLEHQLFQEDDGHTAFEYFAKLGSVVNAFTSYNLTCYEVIASNHFKENLQILLNFVENPVFKSSSIATEKNIIKEEIKMYENNPNTVCNYGLEFNLNIKDNHKYMISGTLDDISKINPDVLQKAYETFYVPNNMFIVITGNFKLEALGIIKEKEKARDYQNKRIIIKKNREPLRVKVPYEINKMNVKLSKIKLAYKLDRKIFKAYSDNLLKIYLDAILEIKFGTTSDILERLIDENLVSWNISTNQDLRADYVLISVTLEGEYKEELIDEIRCELLDLKVSKNDLNRIKNANISNLIQSFNDNISVSENIQNDIMSNGKLTTDILNLYKSMNVKCANDIASKVDLSNECIYIVS